MLAAALTGVCSLPLHRIWSGLLSRLVGHSRSFFQTMRTVCTWTHDVLTTYLVEFCENLQSWWYVSFLILGYFTPLCNLTTNEICLLVCRFFIYCELTGTSLCMMVLWVCHDALMPLRSCSIRPWFLFMKNMLSWTWAFALVFVCTMEGWPPLALFDWFILICIYTSLLMLISNCMLSPTQFELFLTFDKHVWAHSLPGY